MAAEKSKEFGLSPEIAKLSEKISKDPSSKLFVPLAEEYRKIGMLDEAIQVLTDGLKANPNYMTARVSLGKILLEKGSISEARDELEKVVQAIPDNLFAHKKLSEIFQSIGDRENLLKEYRIILSLSPKDEEIKNAIDGLEGKTLPAHGEKIPEKPQVLPEPELTAELSEPTSELSPSEEEVPVTEEIMQPEIPEPEEETSYLGSENPEEIRSYRETGVEKPEELIEEVTEAVDEKKEEPVYELPEEAINPEELGIDIPIKMTPVSEGPRTREMEMLEAAIQKKFSEKEPHGGAEIPEPETPEILVEPVRTEELATETLADLYIKQGQYEKADEIYVRLLRSDPDNMLIRQKREELIFLMNFMTKKDSEKGAGKEGKIGKLEAWLENIKERRR